MRHKTLTGVDGRGAGPTAACQEIVGALQEHAAEHTCKQRSRCFTCVTAQLHQLSLKQLKRWGDVHRATLSMNENSQFQGSFTAQHILMRLYLKNAAQ